MGREAWCEDCGGPLFFNHRVASKTGGEDWRYTDGCCERAAEALAALPTLYDMAIQANVEVEQMIGRACSEWDDDEWADASKLQCLLLDALNAASEGVHAETRWREIRVA